MKMLLTGNEAVARGAFEAGVTFASAYPGTPSTEILENLAALYPEVKAEWAPNEKVAIEAAIGASIAGVRSFASMKHVGVNVAADPLFTFAYTGVTGGMVFVSADEPGMHSSQNEQDNRNYAKAARIPMLEPSDSAECHAMVKEAYEISEQFDTPVMLRMTTRVCHSKSVVECAAREEIPFVPYRKQIEKYVMVPANARVRRVALEERLKQLAAFSEQTPLNRVEGSGEIGVIVSGACYCYAKEVFGDTVAYLKLGFTYPLPNSKIAAFCKGKKAIYIIEENDPYLEDVVRRLGFSCHGKDVFPKWGELTADVIRHALGRGVLPRIAYDNSAVVPRPPTLCAGCPHRGFFYELGKRKGIMISGDIGCYTLGSAAPYFAIDSTICMGASLSVGHGAQQAFDAKGAPTRVVSVIGDSTFFHTGINSLIEVLYNGSRTVNVILDNRITGMTGHQENPGSGRHADLSDANAIEIEPLVRALGAKHVYTIDPNDLKLVRETLDQCLALDEPSVIITRWPCVLKRFSQADKQEFTGAFTRKMAVDSQTCIGCTICLRCGCPALSMDPSSSKASIDSAQCVGCGVCAQLCPKGAIAQK